MLYALGSGTVIDKTHIGVKAQDVSFFSYHFDIASVGQYEYNHRRTDHGKSDEYHHDGSANHTNQHATIQ